MLIMITLKSFEFTDIACMISTAGTQNKERKLRSARLADACGRARLPPRVRFDRGSTSQEN